MEDANIAWIIEGVQSGVRKFSVAFAIPLLSRIAETTNPPLLPALDNRGHVRKVIEENNALFNLLGECLQKNSFSEIRSLRKFLVLLSPHSFSHSVIRDAPTCESPTSVPPQALTSEHQVSTQSPWGLRSEQGTSFFE
jgi:hypothetical protein